MKQISGIQMIGTQRSGSNLLRVILDQSADIVSPHPAHVLVTFYPLLHLYEDLDDPANYRRLVSDVVDYIEANPVPWSNVVLDKHELFDRSLVYNLVELNRVVYEQVAASADARYWCCKSMTNVHFSRDLEAGNPGLKYIYLYRDGRDVAASFKKAIVGEKHIYPIAQQWTRDQEACLDLAQKVPESRFHTLSYEELITRPEATVNKLCNFLNIPYRPAMLDFYTSKEAAATAEAGAMWSNLQKPVMADNTGKFRNVLNDNEIEIFELIAGNVMKQLGYPLVTDLRNTGLVAEHAIQEYHIENEQLKRAFYKNADANDVQKRMPQLAILNRIKSR
ncbi:MAG: sulfotransferase [Niabella sp.]|nr:sulfotransferase [Niabella sp.]